MKEFDVIIIGAGPAGTSASIYTSRADLNTLIIDKGDNILKKANELENYYDKELLGFYVDEFGEDNVLWSPVQDFSLVDEDTLLNEILPFLEESVESNNSVVVHC